MAELFQHKAAVTVDTIRVEDLDLAFRIDADLGKKPNKAEVSLFNLAPSHRDELEQLEEAVVVVEAGYESGVTRIFRGDMREAKSTRQGADIVTKIEAADGEQRHRAARTNRSFGRDTRVGDVLSAIASDLGVDPGNGRSVAEAAIETGRKLFTGGTVVSGKAVDELTRVTDSAGLEWSIQGRRLQFLERGKALKGTAVRLTPDTGLLGSPELSSKGVLRARMLIIPDVFPGRRIQIESEHVDGIFRVEKCSYIGDTSADSWDIEVEAKAEQAGRAAA